jgi:hypothetical protein
MLKTIIYGMMALANLSALVQGAGELRRPVEEVRQLLIEAIDAPAGEAHGRLTGQIADAIGRQFKTAEPINVDVTTLIRYAEDGCRRLSVLFWQDGVQLGQGAPAKRQTVEFGINYCRTGMPPRSLDRAVQP